MRGEKLMQLLLFFEQDLGSMGGPPRNWKGIGIAMVVILGVMSLVSLSIFLLTPGKTEIDGITDLTPSEEDISVLQYAAWGPQGNQMVYVFENDIYYKPDVSSKAMRLTATGRNGMVVNGLSDWTYEEEILLKYPAFWWAKDGARLAYLSINNSATPFMEIHHFLGGIYPSNVLYPYPKAGSRIPSASLFVVNLYGPAHTLEMIPPDSQNSRDSYISMVSWISSTRLTVRWLNRVQNQSVLCVCEATTGACSERHQMAMEFWHYNQRQEEPLFTADGSLFYLILPAKQGARGDFLHIASLPAQTSTPSVSPRFLTSGNWDVTSLCALDEENDKMYDRSNFMSKPFQLESLKTLGGVFHRQCLTCNLFERCSVFKADFSPNQTYFTLYCLGKIMPSLVICQHLLLSVLCTCSDSIPGRQSVTEEFALGWPEVLSSLHGVALAWIGSRSRISQGQKSSALDPHKLSSLNIKDKLGLQSSDISLLLTSQGLGGYLGLKMLTATDQMFKCAAVMAPITDFKLYSAAFSERYLGLPNKEEHSYMAASLLEDIHKLKNENFLLIHGTADARVHFQHSAELLSRLVKIEANYSLQLYPDEGHTLREERSNQHLHRTLLHYLHNCLEYDPFLNIEEEEEEDEEEE
uniref:Uncharacterized protein n=1 Tax=Cyprinus carpio TaxID=7962 RepID=A0A8C1IU25_CYPCA